jgi:NADH-quinone oxidoreductase subunit L
MTIPLIILAAFSLFAGVLNPGFGILKERPMDHWLEPVFKAASEKAVIFAHNNDASWAEHMEWPLALGGIGAFAIGTTLAWWVYISKRGEPAQRLAQSQPGLYRLLLDKWRIDELYDVTIVSAVDALADTSAAFDQNIVDGIIAKLTGFIVSIAGSILRAFQTGVIHVYAAFMAIGLAWFGWFFVAPHPAISIHPGKEAGDYMVTAAPGMGYQYRWDTHGTGQFDSDKMSDLAVVKVHVNEGATQTVLLEATSAFGLHRSTSVPISRPARPLQVGQNQ